MVDIAWCKKQSKGISLIEPNENLCKEYLESAEETLDFIRNAQKKSNMWIATTRYYAEYFIIYALLMKLGIKCEIHECTIKLCKFLEKEELLPKNTSKRLKKDKTLRIKNQYYLKNLSVDLNDSELINFILQIKNIINTLTIDKIKEIRKKIKEI